MFLFDQRAGPLLKCRPKPAQRLYSDGMGGDRITELHLTSFTSYRDVALPLAPLIVLIGRNGAGMSNALEALSRLAKDGEIRDALDGARRDAGPVRCDHRTGVRRPDRPLCWYTYPRAVRRQRRLADLRGARAQPAARHQHPDQPRAERSSSIWAAIAPPRGGSPAK